LSAAASSPIRVYGYRYSGHAHRVELFLSILGLAYEREEVDLRAGEHKTPAFLALNPFGQVPVIRDGETVLADSNAILVYLATKYAPEGWLPRDAAGAGAVQRWLSMAAGPIAYGLSAARRSVLFGRGLDPAAQGIGRSALALLDEQLAAGGFLAGEAPTIADLALYAYVARAPEGEVALEPFPHVLAWLARIEALDGFIPMPPMGG
jgi:glutathione S-transferase